MATLSTIQFPTPDGPKTLDHKQIGQLLGLSFRDGKSIEHNRPFLFEIIGVMRIDGFEPVYNRLKESLPLLTNPQDALFEQEAFKGAKLHHLSDVEKMRVGAKSIEGVQPCPKCHSRNTITMEKQTRSGDEATSSLSLCFACGNKWS